MDRIIATEFGYNCIVDGVCFGTWRSKSEAKAGMATEQARVEAKKAAESAYEIAYLDQRTQDYHEWRNRD